MSNVFKRFTEVVNKPNRAPYDLSFQNNLTMKFGKLYPVFCKEVLPGDSFKIQPTFNFNFMPLVSPVQTRMKATLHFFYVRNRPQWKDFMDWDGMTKEGLTPPYIKLTQQNRDMLNTGNIGDFLGVPSIVFDKVTSKTSSMVSQKWYENGVETDTFAHYPSNQIDSFGKGSTLFDVKFSDYSFEEHYYPIFNAYLDNPELLKPSTEKYLNIAYAANIGVAITLNYFLVVNDVVVWKSQDVTYAESSGDFQEPSQFDISDVDFSSFSDTSVIRVLAIPRIIYNYYDDISFTWASEIETLVSDRYDVKDKPLSDLPWASDDNPDGLRLNAFPFRAYEAIYNSFYRDERNNPRMVNGQPEYNKYITTDEGGADTTHYKLFQRNWEPDYLTTAVQSPQQGVAPLVGITSVSAAGTIEITDGNGVTYTAQTKLAEDGDTIQGIRVLSENSPTAVNRALVDLASTGISISDLRNVNALQRWLEINMRRGLRYRDQVKSHYGVDIEFKELQMPEFIGGVNEDVIVNRISQTVETEENPLGSLAGQAGVLGTSKHKISHYCDEKGFIIGIFSIAPVPNYSQNLPKHMIKTSQLDYFTPEFAHIGMQPILNSEVTPLQANLEGKLNDVFGYQRPWYEYLASTDEVHGQFRDSMRRYLINRVYDGTPELGSEFLTIDPETINDVFAVTEDTDKIYGQIWFDVTAKRPIASNVTPRIEP